MRASDRQRSLEATLAKCVHVGGVALTFVSALAQIESEQPRSNGSLSMPPPPVPAASPAVDEVKLAELEKRHAREVAALNSEVADLECA